MMVPVALGSRLRGNDEKGAGGNDEGAGMTNRNALMTSEEQETH
jgi:hypothetical protein